jgi:hypothetical protein
VRLTGAAARPRPQPAKKEKTTMAMLRICAADGCNTKTLGLHCIQHEPVPQLAFVRHGGPQVKVGNLVQLR